MTLHLTYETHALTADNELGIATGWLPGELSVEGRRLAAELGARRRAGVSRVFVSDLARAVETARIAFEGSAIPVLLDERLRECNYGELNGAAAARVAGERARRISAPFPGGQSYMDVVRLTASFLQQLAHDHDGDSVLVIAHSANKWALDYLLHGVPLERSVVAPFGWREGWRYEVVGGWKWMDPADTPQSE